MSTSQSPPSPYAAFTISGCCSSTCLRYLPVCEVGCSATSSGVALTTICPPLSPPFGPRSMIQSEQRITSRLCSVTRRSLCRSEISKIDSHISQIPSHSPKFSQLATNSYGGTNMAWLHSAVNSITYSSITTILEKSTITQKQQ